MFGIAVTFWEREDSEDEMEDGIVGCGMECRTFRTEVGSGT